MTFLPSRPSRRVLVLVFTLAAAFIQINAAPAKKNEAARPQAKPSSVATTKSSKGLADSTAKKNDKPIASTSRNADRKSNEVVRQKSSKMPERSSTAVRANSAQSSKREKEALRRAEQLRRESLARAAAEARQMKEDSLRDDVRAMISRDDLSGEDIEVRRVAQSALGNRAGTVVVMDPRTGRIYSIVNQEWAVREGFKPCSTIKLVTGLAGLNEEVIDPNDTTRVSDSNNASLTNALAYSKNGYFQEIGGQVGFDKMVSYARELGLGEKTGINMRNEFAGQLPASNVRASIARMSSHGDNFEVTPLQLATLVSAMGNGGKLVVPHVVRSRQDELKFRAKVRRQIPIDSDAWRSMIPGMVGAVSYGSGRKAHDPSQTVAGKTGTCIERGGWVGLFTSYAPLTNPTLAVVVITRGADARGHVPAAVAGRIYRGLNGRFGTSNELQVTSKRRSPGQESYTQTSVVDISEEDRNELGNRTKLIGSKASPTKGQVTPVLMQFPAGPPVRTEKKNVDSEPASTNSDGQTRPRRVSSL